MSYFVYNLLLWVGCVLGAPAWIVLAMCRNKWRAGLMERLGFVPARLQPSLQGGAVVWVHAVSVGEVIAATGLIRELQREYQVFVSTTTSTGQMLARERFGAEHVFYFPIDLQFAIGAYLRRLRPKMLVLLETEFWPNLLRSTAHAGAKIAVVNARISDRSLPGYMRWRDFLESVLKNCDIFVAQSQEDANRLQRIGAPQETVIAGGNLKFDWAPPPESAIVERLRSAIIQAGVQLVVVAGSTVEGEEQIVLRAFEDLRREFARALLILAPRRPERSAGVTAVLESSGAGFVRRSEWDGRSLPQCEVLLLDSMGELGSVYALADIAFVGGSLVPRGGHNVLEPAYFGKAIVVGPHMENFRDIVRALTDAGALRICDSSQIGACWVELARDVSARHVLGERARAVMQANTGATQRTLDAVRSLMRSGR